MAVSTEELAPPTEADLDSSTTSEDEPGRLYRHTKRPEWGVAILAWERGERRAYQFEDGRLRKFQRGYYSLLKPAKETERPRKAVLASLENAVQAKGTRTAGKALTPVASFQDQVALFNQLFPKGFQDPEWREEHRMNTSGRTLKRHREPAVERAAESLSREECEELLAEGRYQDMVLAVRETLAGTDLVPVGNVKALDRFEGEQNRTFAESVFDMLHGDGDFDARFGEHLTTLGELLGSRPSWRLATTLPALVYPQKQVCVRRSVFLRQAASIAPTAPYTKKARIGSYQNFRRVAFAVKKRLEAEGLEPADLLDIHDFIWVTLRNAALDDLKD